MERASSRLRLLALLVALMFIALSTRLWFLQVLASDRFSKQAVDNSVRITLVEPLRGQVYDATGEPLVTNQPALEVRVNRQEMGDQAEAIIFRLANLLEMDVSALREEVNDVRYFAYQDVPVARFVDEEVDYFIAEHADEFPGVTVEPASARAYPHGRLAAHLVGQVGLIEGEDYEDLKEQGYGQNDEIGRSGLELLYEKYLRGRKGREKVIVNADGEVIRRGGTIEPVNGDDVYLNLEIATQAIAEEELFAGMIRARQLEDSNGKALRANSGAVVVLDADTGAVRAMASLPSFDPSWYVRGLRPLEARYLENDNVGPLVSRAFQLRFTPGSTFKSITSLITVEQGLASLGGYYPCTTEYIHGEDTANPFLNWEPADDTISFHEALVRSCDTFFYRFGSEFYEMYVDAQLGADAQPLQRELRRWGFGAETGLGLPGEDPGLVPDAAWAAENPLLFEEGRWQPFGDILTMTGAGNIAVTPLQLAVAYGAIANGGALCQPQLLQKVVAADGQVVREPGPHCEKSLPYTDAQYGYIRSALGDVVDGGTATCPFNGFPFDQVAVAGKTGTAERGDADQFDEQFQDTSWFAAMVGEPGQEPDYVVVTMVEQGGFGSQVAAPITRSVIERIEGLTSEESPRLGCAVPEEDF